MPGAGSLWGAMVDRGIRDVKQTICVGVSRRTWRLRSSSRAWLPPRLQGLALLHGLAERPRSHCIEGPKPGPDDLAPGEDDPLPQAPVLELAEQLVILDREAELSANDVGATRRLGLAPVAWGRCYGRRGRPGQPWVKRSASRKRRS